MILVTGAAGFIGFHVAKRLLDDGFDVVGVDNLNDYYDVSLKQARLDQIINHPNFRFERIDIADRITFPTIFENYKIERVIHLAAQAGVRYSMDHPHEYVDSNLVGFVNVLEACRHYQIEHLVYASSSSVYGNNEKIPFSVDDNVDQPISLYAATKKANELMAHTYSHLYGMQTTGLRFFTVYGPWGRPDMAYFSFTKAVLEGLPIKLFHYGDAERDFTYIDDIVEGIVRVLALKSETSSGAVQNYRLFNIGNHSPVPLLRMVEIIEECTGQKAVRELVPAHPGDVPRTFADIDDLTFATGFSPTTSIEVGLERFVIWYTEYLEKATLDLSIRATG
jgi:UDP-glucuronate 4-epimerase